MSNFIQVVNLAANFMIPFEVEKKKTFPYQIGRLHTVSDSILLFKVIHAMVVV